MISVPNTFYKPYNIYFKENYLGKMEKFTNTFETMCLLSAHPLTINIKVVKRKDVYRLNFENKLYYEEPICAEVKEYDEVLKIIGKFTQEGSLENLQISRKPIVTNQSNSTCSPVASTPKLLSHLSVNSPRKSLNPSQTTALTSTTSATSTAALTSTTTATISSASITSTVSTTSSLENDDSTLKSDEKDIEKEIKSEEMIEIKILVEDTDNKHVTNEDNEGDMMNEVSNIGIETSMSNNNNESDCNIVDVVDNSNVEINEIKNEVSSNEEYSNVRIGGIENIDFKSEDDLNVKIGNEKESENSSSEIHRSDD
jgi:hypothetical protein